MSAYNGGLFDRDQHEFLAENEVSDRYIAEVIYRLGTTETVDGSFALADYADLDTRHLGTIYEGLLEHEFRIAPEEYAAVAADGGQVWKPATAVSVADAVETVEQGELYVVNDEGERKATGAYYTPDYVVSYIVEETVDPLIEELEADLDERGLERGTQEYVVAFWNGVTDLRVLDPAMGSGHFLTSATEYLASATMERVRELETATLFDEQQIRREISRECIYGVDLNGMAVELAKLSMWLETLATDQPLAFLDHHLKAGNSLVGSDISEVLGTDEPSGTEQATLFDDFSRTRRQALEHVMELVEDLLAIENRTVDDAKRMEDLYEEIREDDLYERLFGMANVHTAERFDLDVPEGAYKQMANAIDDEAAWTAIEDDEDWYTTAQAMAEEEQFFHWELEYPEVFFSADGERAEGAGFDAVIGNPPYVRMEKIKHLKPYLSSEYRVHASRMDLYGYFVEQSLDLTNGQYAIIVSNKWMRSQYGENLREILSERQIRSILDFGDLEVFEGISTYPCILAVDAGRKLTDDIFVAQFDNLGFADLRDRAGEIGGGLPPSSFGAEKWSIGSVEQEALKSSLEEQSVTLSKYLKTETKQNTITDGIGWGIKTGGNDAFVIDEQTRDELIASNSEAESIIKPLVKGTDIERYFIKNEQRYLIYTKKGINIDQYPAVKAHLENYRDQIGSTATDEEWYELQQGQEEYVEFFESEKICYPDISKECSFAMDQSGQYLANTCYFIPSDSYALLGLLNSSPVNWFYQFTTSEYRGGFQRSFTHAIRNLPIPPAISEIDADDSDQNLGSLAKRASDLRKTLNSLNLDLTDHLGSYDDGETLADIGFTQPPENAADSILQATTEQHPNLRVGDCEVVRESSSTVEIRLTARYKPEDEDAHETDQWGYTETEFLPALRITDLSETEADLIAAFVPVAVDEAGGFAGFRETATKTNSLVDRLRALTLPRVDDVADGLAQYRETKQRADELDAKIQRTDDLIDEIVYELYGLTDEEIEIVEESVA
nr:TaqI-like C-terminal specificity domain-containing protein [Halolamina pelagica]